MPWKKKMKHHFILTDIKHLNDLCFFGNFDRLVFGIIDLAMFEDE